VSQFQFNIVNFRKDSYITVESRQKAECFFIIQQGKVKISKSLEIKGYGEETLVAGDFFGVVSAMSSHSHIERAMALTDVTLIAIRPQQYESLIQKNTQVAVKILTQLSARLRVLDEALTRATLKNGNGAKLAEDGASRLFGAAEYYYKHKRYGQAFYVYNTYLKHCPAAENLETAAKRLEMLEEYADEAMANRGDGEMNRTYPKGVMLFAEGEPGEELFVIQSGSISISKIVDGKEMLLGMLKAGDILGEMALLEDKPRAASAMATEDCVVMAVSKANFEILIRKQPQVVSKITTLLAGRIWFIFKQLENALIDNPLGRVYGAMLIQLEKNRVNLDSTSLHLFSSKWDEFVNMLGLTEKEGYIMMGELQKDKNVQVNKGRVHVDSVQALVKMAEYYQKMDKIGKAKGEGRSK